MASGGGASHQYLSRFILDQSRHFREDWVLVHVVRISHGREHATGSHLRPEHDRRHSTAVGVEPTALVARNQYENRIELLQGTLDMLVAC
jgi:hypothetical protein